MKITSAIASRYSLPLKRPLQLKGDGLAERHGIVIEFRTDTGLSAWGDVCPLPGFSVESLDQAENMLRLSLRELIGQDVTQPLRSMMPPSFGFACESAALQLRAAAEQTTPAKLLSPSSRDVVSVNGLLTGSEDEICRRAEKLVSDGYSTLKLKVGRRPVADDVRVVREVRRIAGHTVAIRLDGNQLMTPDQYEQFANEVVTENIEYIEEPTSDIRKLFGVHPSLVPILPIALDETLSLMEPDELAYFSGGAAAIVVKPTILGFDRAWRFCQIADRLSIPSTISAAFCSGVGLVPHVWMAAAANDRDIAAGFDSAAWFARDLLEPTVGIVRGKISLHTLPDPATSLEHRLLTEVHRV